MGCYAGKRVGFDHDSLPLQVEPLRQRVDSYQLYAISDYQRLCS